MSKLSTGSVRQNGLMTASYNPRVIILVSSEFCFCLQSSVLGSGFGELGGPKLGQTAGQQILEQLKGPGLGQLTSQPPSSGDDRDPVGGLGGTGMPVPSSSWDIKPPGTQSSASLPSQFSRKFHSTSIIFTPVYYFRLPFMFSSRPFGLYSRAVCAF